MRTWTASNTQSRRICVQPAKARTGFVPTVHGVTHWNLNPARPTTTAFSTTLGAVDFPAVLVGLLLNGDSSSGLAVAWRLMKRRSSR